MPPVAGHQYLLFPPTRPLAERFGAEFFRAIPEAPGVYLMSTARDGVLYVGKAKNLRRRLGSYRSGTGERLPPKIVRLLLRVERIDWDLCPDEAAALARERALIRALQPRFNRQGVRPPQEWLLGWHRDMDAGRLTLGLWRTPEEIEDTPEPRSRWTAVNGPFVFARPAFAALLRQLWLEAHPDATVVDLPSCLLSGPTPRRWTVPWSDRVAAWLAGLQQFLSFNPPTSRETNPPPPPSQSSEPAPVADPTPACASFEAQWRALDAESLAEFKTRNYLHASPSISLAATSGKSGNQNHA